MEIIWSKIARSQIKEIHTIYALNTSTEKAKNLSTKLIDRTKILIKFPEIGSPQKFTQEQKILKKHKYRYLVEGKHKIIYYIEGNKIRISIVFHTSQEPEKIDFLLNNEI